MSASKLNKKLQAAEVSGKYFITVSYVDKKGKLQHFWIAKDYTKADVTSSLDHLKADVETK